MEKGAGVGSNNIFSTEHTYHRLSQLISKSLRVRSDPWS